MNKNYESVEEFLMDSDFRQWILNSSPESDLFWKAWIKNNPDHVRELLLAKELLLTLKFEENPTDRDRYDRVLENVLAGQYSTRSGRRTARIGPLKKAWTYFKVAAVLVMAAFLFIYIYTADREPSVAVSTNIILKENPAGRKSQVFLPDGTVVWLNSESRIEYEVNRKDQKRVVKLTGEAFFDVAKDKHRPFIVETSNCSVTAIGTQFNVKAFPDELMQKVSLSEGIVSVLGKDESGRQAIILNPGEALRVDKQNGEALKTKFNSKEAIGWKTGILYFQDASFQEVISELQRWYGKKFMIEGSARIGTWKFSSEFHDETLENVLKSISYAKHFNYKIEDDIVKLIF